jgi:threonine synthase
VEKDEHIITLGERFTPLIKDQLNGRDIYLKLEYVSPSGSFKDRGSSVLISKLKELKVPEFIEDSSGNAGISLSMYAARAKISASIYVPDYIASNKLIQLKLLGAKINLVKGTRDDVSKKALDAASSTCYASHALNPFFIEGTKTAAFELYEQLNCRLPDSIFVPAGNGTLLLGLYKGFYELMQLNITEKIPPLFAIQPQNCAPLEYFLENNNLLDFIPKYSIAEGTVIAKPPRLKEMIQSIKYTGGDIIAVSEEEIKNATIFLNKSGYFVEYTGALAWAGYLKVKDRGPYTIVFLTGSGSKIIRDIQI